MTRTAIIPPNEAAWHAMRARDVTSTESPALFDMSPYATAFELWHRKRDEKILTLDPNERMEWGTELQDSIATVLGRRYGVKVRKVPEYISLNDARMGASFDYEMRDLCAPNTDGILAAMLNDHGPGIFEIKAVDYGVFRDAWPEREDGLGRQAPAHIEIQVQHQMHVRGMKWGAIGVLVGGNRGHVIVRKYDEAVGQAIESRIRAFWQSIASDDAPPPKFPGDEEFIIGTLFGESVRGKLADMRGDEEVAELIAAYREAGDREKLAEEDKKIAKAKLLLKAGDADRALVDGGSLTLGMVKGSTVSYERAPYRMFKFNPSGGKK